MEDAQVTRWVAVYGAVVSTAIAAWTIYRDLRDKGRLRVELEIVRRTPGGIITHRDPMTTADHCVVTITNVGRRPITASHLLGYQGSLLPRRQQRFYVRPQTLPRELGPGVRTIEWVQPLYMPVMARLRRLAVMDTTARRWRPSRSSVRRVRRRCAEVMRAVNAIGAGGGTAQ